MPVFLKFAAMGACFPVHQLVKIFFDKLTGWLERLKKYNQDIHICGDRNSYSKTDHDATFMRMKEDYMKNGQLKPGYNVNVATASGYVIGNFLSADRTDTKVFVSMMKKLCSKYPVKRVGVDSF